MHIEKRKTNVQKLLNIRLTIIKRFPSVPCRRHSCSTKDLKGLRFLSRGNTETIDFTVERGIQSLFLVCFSWWSEVCGSWVSLRKRQQCFSHKIYLFRKIWLRVVFWFDPWREKRSWSQRQWPSLGTKPSGINKYK